MNLRRWNDLPIEMRTEAVQPYYELLAKKKNSILLKRIFDVFVSGFLLLLLCPVFLILSILVKVDSKGPAFYKQERVTQYGNKFYIFKFRTMVVGADKKGSLVTVKQDQRITKVGKILRKYRLDEFPQLINILKGDMTFVGTRPEVPKYVNAYTEEMYATLLLPSGVTSNASIMYKDEDRLLSEADDVDCVYINQVLPEKMKYNLEELKSFSVVEEIKIMIRTVLAVIK